MSFGKLFLVAAAIGLMTGCGRAAENIGEGSSMVITAEEAKSIMDSREDYILLDVREQEEYDEGHIAGAILIPYGSIGELAENVLPDREQTILVYCRSGRRSAIAAEELVRLGYTDVRDFGGIIDWPYEVEK